MKMLTRQIPLDVSPGEVRPVIHVSQYDAGSRTLVFQLMSRDGELELPVGTQAEIRGTKPDGHGFSYEAQLSGNTVTVEVTEQMTAVAGRTVCEITLFTGTQPTTDTPASDDYTILSTANFILSVEHAALDKNTVQSASEIRQLIYIMDHKDEIIAAANKTDENVTTVGELTERAETAAEGAEASEEAAAETLDTVNEKAAQILAVTTDADRTASQALALAGTAAAEAGATSAQLDEVMNRLNEVNLTLDEKVAGAYEESGYLYLTSQGAITVGPLGPFAGGSGGGGGGSSNNAVLTATNTTGWLSKTITLGMDCVLSITWSSLEEGIPTGSGSVSVLVNNIEKRTVDIAQGSWSINVADFLTAGQNKVRIVVSDVYGNVKALNFSVKTVELKVSTLFDHSLPYGAGAEIAFTYVPYGAVEKTVFFQVDGTTIGTQTVTTSGRQQTFAVPGMTHGSHRFVCFFTAEIDGETVESNVLDFDLIIVDEQATTPIIASDFRDSDARQYQTLSIPYRVFTPNALSSQVTLWAGDTQVAALTVGRQNRGNPMR